MATKKNSITLCISGPDGVTRQSLSEVDSVILGSGAGVAVKIADPLVSNFHVMLKVDANGTVKAIDLGSDSGTTVGGKAIAGPTALQPGDVLTLGKSQVQVLFGDEPATRPVPVEPGPNRATALPPVRSFSADPVLANPAPRVSPPPPPVASMPRNASAHAPVIPSAPRAAAFSAPPGLQAATTAAAPKRKRASPSPMLFGELRRELAPSEQEKVLQVAMLWGDQVLNVRQFADGVPVTIGESGKNPFQFYAPTVGSAFTLAAANGVKRVVNIPADADVVVRSNGKLKPADQNALELGLNDRVQVQVADLSFVLQYVKPAPEMPKGERSRADKIFAGISLFVLLLGVSLTVLGLRAKQPDYPELAGKKVDENVVRMVFKQQQEKKKKETKIAQKQGAEEGAKAKDEEGQMGKVAEQPKQAEASKKGTQLTDAQKKERDRQRVNNTGLLAAFGKDAGSISDIRGPGGHGGGLNDALGGLKTGGVSGNQAGVGGMGSKGSGKGGGGTGLTIGGLGTKGDGPGMGGSGFDLNAKGKDTVRIIPGKTIVEGGLPKDVIAQIIRSHEKEIKYCYELELNKDPSLNGKVAAFFIIDGSGAVSEANVSESTLNSDTAERCMLSKIKRWKFPEPKGGGIVSVTYPWVFKPSAGDQ